jgi:hypothetical protein
MSPIVETKQKQPEISISTKFSSAKKIFAAHSFSRKKSVGVYESPLIIGQRIKFSAKFAFFK